MSGQVIESKPDGSWTPTLAYAKQPALQKILNDVLDDTDLYNMMSSIPNCGKRVICLIEHQQMGTAKTSTPAPEDGERGSKNPSEWLTEEWM